MFIIKTFLGALLAGIVYTILMGIYFKNKGIDPKRKYVSGISFSIVLFIVHLILNFFNYLILNRKVLLFR